MKNLVIFIFIIVTFNACSVTNHYTINSNLEFESIPEKDRKTYIYFGKEQFVKVSENKIIEEAEDDFSDEFVEEEDIIDPLESYNRVMTSFNDFLFTSFLDPLAKNYSNIIPENRRINISNFFVNIKYPIRFVNNILQFKFSSAVEETGRFLINSTIGVLGFNDVASEKYNLKKREEDFGQTLGYYGIKEGFHIVMPLLGPSNLRDRIGSAIDGNFYIFSYNSMLTDNINYIESTSIGLYKTLNSTSLNLGQYQNLKKDAIDLYPFLRDIYTQNREKQIKE